ncbi:uncharacterized protein ATNIH1004_007230 [Aspergillus tanneri]|uniref:Uncharacterized protein n=1 Tax=Aspergillus tanneri TaxID=1220188 RepID=A0A5M9MMX4_9EURO|nr:uncharacterized protein ATNIH1004_007230 [Aspergillus tanneri]KAA8645809.1 hypothetical protein ATNIH1004_007230 [Aspergillus tanneri]
MLALPLTSSAASLDVLKFKNWDLHILAPGCNPNNSNFDISLYHRSGITGNTCTSLIDDSNPDRTKAETISWKSPIASHYDLCTFRDGNCSKDSFIEAVRSLKFLFESGVAML